MNSISGVGLNASNEAESVDELLLAAYLSQGLPSELRAEIESYLLGSGDARELLGMANEAMQEAKRFVTKPSGARLDGTEEVHESQEAGTDNGANTNRLWPISRSKLFRTPIISLPLLLPLLVIILAALFWMSSPFQGSSLSAGRATVVEKSLWTPILSRDKNILSWPPVPGATSYGIVIFNEEKNILVNAVGSDGTRISNLQSLAYASRDVHAIPLSIWVMAFDAQNEFILSSERVSINGN